MEIEDYYFATSQLAQTTLRSVIGQSELDELLAEREQINETVREIIDVGTDPWGIDVTGVEVKDIDLPQEMKRAMARQAEAERERRAKVISAEGEYQASARLAQAARVMSKDPASLQLRFLQTVVEVAAENNSTTLFPVPIDLIRPFLESTRKAGDPVPDDDAVAEESEGLPRSLESGEVTALLDAAQTILGAGNPEPTPQGAKPDGAQSNGDAD